MFANTLLTEIKSYQIRFCSTLWTSLLTCLRTFTDDVGPRGGPEVEVTVDGELGRLVALESDIADVSAVS